MKKAAVVLLSLLLAPSLLRAAEKFTRVYVPCVLLATALAIVVPPLVFKQDWSVSFLRAMSMLIGASPCALAISTPAAVLAGLHSKPSCTLAEPAVPEGHGLRCPA